MPDKEQSEKRKEPSGRPLSEEEWIDLMNKHDRLHPFAKERKKKHREKKGDE